MYLEKNILKEKWVLNWTYSIYIQDNKKDILILEYNIHNLLRSYNVIPQIKIDGKTEWFLKTGFMIKKCKIDDEIRKYKVRGIEI